VQTRNIPIPAHGDQPGPIQHVTRYLGCPGTVIGSPSQLIRGAAILAIEDGSEQITRDLLEAVPVDYAAERGGTAARRRARLPQPGSALFFRVNRHGGSVILHHRTSSPS
jgi:hypothetical protein